MESSLRKDQVLRNLWGNQDVDQMTLQITPYIAEELVERLKAVHLEDIGSSEWYTHHQVVQQLNLHAHQQASAATDEFIMDTIVTKDKIYHEALLVNLLEVLLYHKTAAQAADAHLVDLVDYINRQVVYLDITQLSSPLPSVDKGAQALPSDEEELDRQAKDHQFKICMTCLSILRFLTDHRDGLPVTVTTRLLDQHDILLSLVSLMERKPWYRTRPNGEREFFEDQQWTLQRSDEASMSKVEAQVWLSIYNLVMDQECRNRYEMTTYRRDTLLRLRRHLNETVHDQIPPLMDLHRALEQLAITGQHPEEKHRIPPILVELSAEVREKLLDAYAGKWKEVAERQKTVYSEAKEEDLSRLSNFMVALPFESAASKRCRTCGRHADQRCAKCKVTWYCTRECQIHDWRNHKEICRAVSPAT
ncbi:MYND finger domain-containing protein [Toxoplasma gondii ME49]|uniref:MYND finger domain-containing protein n=15 Tax=Toxoplasma gondii TaxID=5811 RepID=A0A125YHX0_TOXGV|nr:MYND finger domain-containing protein [Toxoplasma gondii ME49]EPR62334.1 MYND finger domain-containing protein [Toxoplasma gondii GT1]ESS32712.1 MYND finger domain-containing protein [Toxoplasma gondii VEG]KAF4640831.1 MYND finger domain-containing protein [Toxoplasma gondii]KFG44985.1 MYND finger domain-containing protein [Toxoplasma gondii GAB2-2007-GAL-DOM2]EPT27296.1 MYND finger domain-containing protein [Toxoplasma gondii ME49]|eukprot:XP_018636095.1 MYND finger domain-containing protein [Toxoplasma gondii ME49]